MGRIRKLALGPSADLRVSVGAPLAVQFAGALYSAQNGRHPGPGRAKKNLPPSLPACFRKEFNAENPLILPFSRRRMINLTSRRWGGREACDLRGLGGRSSGKRSSAAASRGAAPHPSGAGRAWNTDTALDEGRRRDRRGVIRAFRDRASWARPARRGLRPARSEQGRSPGAPGQRSRGASVLVETVFLQKLPGLARRSAALPDLQRLSA